MARQHSELAGGERKGGQEVAREGKWARIAHRGVAKPDLGVTEADGAWARGLPAEAVDGGAATRG